MAKRIPIEARFWLHTKQHGSIPNHCPELGQCWEWQGGTYGGRLKYGKLSDAGRGPLSAHRVSYEIAYGPIPEGMDVCHKCDNPICVNPHHLFLGTPADNLHDAVVKNRIPKGESRARSKLTASQIPEIRQMYNKGRRGYGYGAVARTFGVAEITIRNIINGKAWTHVPNLTAGKV